MVRNIAVYPCNGMHWIPVGEVSVVVVGPRRHPGGDGFVELARVQPPLLARVAPEERLVQLAPDRARAPRRPPCGRARACSALLRRNSATSCSARSTPKNRLTVCRLIGIGNRMPRTSAKHPVLVRPPRREARQIVQHGCRVGVEDVRPIRMDQHAGRIDCVIRVAADMRPAVDHEHPPPGPGRQTARPAPSRQTPRRQQGDRNAAASPAAPRASGGTRRRPLSSVCIRAQIASHDISRSIASAARASPARSAQQLDRRQPRMPPACRRSARSRSCPILADHVGDRRSRRPAGRRQIFRRLGRADEPRRLVDRERHHRGVPVRDIGGQLGIGFRAEIMDVRRPAAARPR